MRLVTFKQGGKARVGALSPAGDQVLDLRLSVEGDLIERGAPKAEAQADLWVGDTMLNFLEGGESSLELARQAQLRYGARADRETVYGPTGTQLTFAMSEVQLLAPIPRPTKMVCIGGNYQSTGEVIGMTADKVRSKYPNTFTKASTSVLAPGGQLILPKVSNLVYAELELCVIMGKRGRYIDPKQAYDHIVGYTIGIDVTAHDILVKDWYMLSGRHVRAADPNVNEAPLNAGLAFRGKSFDTFSPLGPWIVTKDEIPDPHTLDIRLKINDDIMQDGNTRDMVCQVPDFVKWVSDVVTVEPGDVYFTGSLPDWRGLKPGDTLTASISGIGELQVHAKAEA